MSAFIESSLPLKLRISKDFKINHIWFVNISESNQNTFYLSTSDNEYRIYFASVYQYDQLIESYWINPLIRLRDVKFMGVHFHSLGEIEYLNIRTISIIRAVTSRRIGYMICKHTTDKTNSGRFMFAADDPYNSSIDSSSQCFNTDILNTLY